MDLSRIKDLANRLSLTNLARSLNEIQGTEKSGGFWKRCYGPNRRYATAIRNRR